MTRKNTIPPILPETFEAIVAPWLTGIAHKDIVAVESYPASDRQRRYVNLLDNHSLQEKYLKDSDRYLWISVDFRVDPIDDVPDLEATILRKITELTGKNHGKRGDFREKISQFEKKYKKKVILAAFGCEELLASRKIPILIWFTILCRFDSLRMLLFVEANLFSPKTLEIFGKVPAFQPRISIMHLYDHTDTRQFIRHMTAGEWNMHISQNMEDTILTGCKGLLLLVKEALWHLRDHPKATADAIFSHTEMQFNLAALWNGFAKEEQDVLERVVMRQVVEDNGYHSSIIYLERMRFLSRDHSSWRLTVPFLARYVRKRFAQQKQLTLSDQKEIFLDGVPVGMQFSRAQRRVLSHLLLHPEQVISRDAIAMLLWPHDTQTYYSDWAIDSSVSRLRVRLLQLGIGTHVLETKKGKGFILRTTL